MKTAPPDIAIVCVSNGAAQSVVNRLVSVGIRYIWNFANVSLRVPKGVIVQREVIAGGLAMLTVKMKLSSMKPGDTVEVEE